MKAVRFSRFARTGGSAMRLKTEAVWQALIVEDLDAILAATAECGVEPATQETYPNGVRKVTYADPNGSEIAFGEVSR